MARARTGILLTAFGGPDSIEAVGPFMRGFMGREPSGEVLAAAQDKYRAIGGRSPLPDTAESVAQLLGRRLGALGHDAPVRVGMRYWEPSIPSAMAALADAGASRIVMASLSAFDSRITCEAYREAALGAGGEVGVDDIAEAPMLHSAPGFREFFARVLAAELGESAGTRRLVVFTAHSLPVADVREDEPYVSGLREVADAVARDAGLGTGRDLVAGEGPAGIEAFGSPGDATPWVLGYQSRGVRGGDWLGPDLGGVMRSAAEAGVRQVIVVPIGFAIDHMETLWDLDIQAAQVARSLGLAFARTPVPNDDDSLIESLVWAVEPLL